jgi:malate dehydrogenase (oxaloacetate-decarboxylating)(NADP+)
MDEIKARYVKKTDARTLSEVIEGADVFLGLSAGGVMKPEMVAKMAANPLIMALANPTPEITPGTDQERPQRRDYLYRPLGLSESGQ